VNFRQKLIVALIGVTFAAQAAARRLAYSVEKSNRKVLK
jgi:hypothetical protein